MTMSDNFIEHIQTNTDTYQTNKAFLLAQLAELEKDYASLKKPLAKHNEDAPLTSVHIRQRLNWLLDDHQPFLEIGALAAKGTDQPLGGGAIAGIGFVSGQLVVIFGNDHTIKGGTLNVYAYKKWQRALTIALTHRLPYISLVQSAGYDLDLEKQAQSTGLTMPHFGSSGNEFYLMCQLSKAKIPSVCIVFGSCTAGGAYQPALSDYTIFVKEQAKVYLAGPPLVKMATGEENSHEALGGADMHAKVSGLADFLADHDYDACQKCREVISQFPSGKKVSIPSFKPPRQSLSDLLGWLDPDLKYAVDMNVLISRLVDADSWLTYKPLFGETLLCGWGNVMGYPVAIIANNGNLTKDAALKSTSFIQLANQQSRPIIFLHNNTGFMVGEAAERAGIIKAGAALIKAMSNSTVPHISLLIGASYGAGTYAMCGPGFAPNFTFAWPTAKCNVMGATQMSGVMAMIKKKAIKPESGAADFIHKEATKQERALTLASELVIDGIIDPRDTRSLLGLLMYVFAQTDNLGSLDMGTFRF